MPGRVRRSLYPSTDTVDTFLTQSSGSVTNRIANLPQQVCIDMHNGAIRIQGDEVALKTPSNQSSKR